MFVTCSRFVQLSGPHALNVLMGVRIPRREPALNIEFVLGSANGKPGVFEAPNGLGSTPPPRANSWKSPAMDLYRWDNNAVIVQRQVRRSSKPHTRVRVSLTAPFLKGRNA